jgi:hypothetical protein
MSNFSSNVSSYENSTASLMSLDELLSTLGYYPYKEILATFVLPAINVLGLAFCALSLFIFSKKKFVHPSYFYYRLLCLVYIIHQAHNIPRGILFSPRYFPTIDTYMYAWFQIYYLFITTFLFHIEDVLQMGILLDRMAMFSEIVKKYFTASPRIVSLAFALTCLFIELPFAFSLKVTNLGDCFFLDESTGQKIKKTIYSYGRSDFSATQFGVILIGFTSVFLNLFLTLVIGITLNIVSVYLYSSYLKQRKLREVFLRASESPNSNEDKAYDSLNTQPKRTLTPKEKQERKIERNMMLMALTLSSISILSRIILLCCLFMLFILFFRLIPMYFIVFL